MHANSHDHSVIWFNTLILYYGLISYYDQERFFTEVGFQSTIKVRILKSKNNNKNYSTSKENCENITE